jgi:hypothetical protein
MATVRWRGDAHPVAQVGTLTPGGTIEATDNFTVTINGKSVTVAAGGTTVADVTAALATALEASTIPEFTEITWEDTTTEVTYTGPSDGTPVTITVATTETGGGSADAQTFAESTTTTAVSPHHWNVGANWSGGSVPANSDDVFLEDSDVDVSFGLDQNSVTLTSLNIGASYTGNVGLPYTNEDGGYIEYRDRYLRIKATTMNVGYGQGNGSSLLNIDNSSAQTTLNLSNTSGSASNNRPSFQWKGTHNSNVVNLQKGSFGAAIEPGETATIATLNIGYINNVQGDVEATIGSGVTMTTLNKSGGLVELNAGATTITQTNGDLTVRSGAVTTLHVQGGNCFYNSTGTLTTANVTNDGLLDFSKDMRSKTITNPINVYGDQAKVNDPFKVTGSVVLDLEQRNTLTGLNLGTNVRLTRGTPS